jgi:hypothetical protein
MASSTGVSFAVAGSANPVLSARPIKSTDGYDYPQTGAHSVKN